MKATRSDGYLRIEVERHGIPAGVNLNFEFDGDWSNQYDDASADEAEAHRWFIQEVLWVLEDKKSEASDSETPAVGQASDEDRGE